MRNAYCLGMCKMTQWTVYVVFRYEIVFGIYFLEFNAGFGCKLDFGFELFASNLAHPPLHFLAKAHEFTFVEILYLWCRVFL